MTTRADAWAVTVCVHNWPTDDLVEHELSPDCVCSPTEERIVSDDGVARFVFTHNSLDGRELTEPDRAVGG